MTNCNQCYKRTQPPPGNQFFLDNLTPKHARSLELAALERRDLRAAQAHRAIRMVLTRLQRKGVIQ